MCECASFGEKERAVVFINNYADVHAMPLPGCLPKYNDFRVTLLPSDVTKWKVYDEYVVASQEIQAAQEVQVCIFGYREFCCLWSETVPYISVMLPSSDLCFTCQQNTSAIMRSSNLQEEEKSQKLKDVEAHLAHAKAERNYYRKQVKESCKVWKAFSDDSDMRALRLTQDYFQCTLALIMHNKCITRLIVNSPDLHILKQLEDFWDLL